MLKLLASICFCTIVCSPLLTEVAQAQPASMQQLLDERQRFAEIWSDCKQQADDWNRRVPAYTAQGQMLPAPACMANMQQLIPLMWLNEIKIAHLNGDNRPGCQIEPMPGCEQWGE